MLAYIEIPKGSQNKYEIDKNKNILVLDRVLPKGMNYPANYGFIPNTLCGDGDPLDVFVVSDEPLVTGTYVEIRPIGYVDMSDEKGHDPKVVAVIKNDPNMLDIKTINDLEYKGLIDFIHDYKVAENKSFEFYDIHNEDKVKELYEKSIKAWKKDVEAL